MRTILLVNKRRLQPATAEALEGLGLVMVDVEPTELDAIMPIHVEDKVPDKLERAGRTRKVEKAGDDVS